MIHRNEEDIIVLSRFHWMVATVWNDPIILENKPNAAFIRGIHTPIIQCKSYKNSLMLDSDDMGFCEMEDIIRNVTIFKQLIKEPNNMFKQIQKEYIDIIIEQSIPFDYIFDLNKIKGMLVIGSFHPDDLPKPLKKLVNLALEEE